MTRMHPPRVALLAFALACTTERPGASDTVIVRWLPVRYVTDRFLVTPVTERGDTLELYTDTGGGSNMLWAPTVSRLGLVADSVTLDGQPARLVELPPLRDSARIPLPGGPEPLHGRFIVMPADTLGIAADGFLGRLWFADRVWVMDYPARTLAFVSRPPDPSERGHQVRLYFKTQRGSMGRRAMHFPRIRIAVAGDSIDLLFDTGARVTLTDSAQAVFASLGMPGPQHRGSSFIAKSVFDRWRAEHPDWRVVERADRLGPTPLPMIEVPLISVAGHDVGPVWFAMRPDRNFHDYMSQWMDQRIDGALGGSALKYFRVTVDYPGATATFERP